MEGFGDFGDSNANTEGDTLNFGEGADDVF